MTVAAAATVVLSTAGRSEGVEGARVSGGVISESTDEATGWLRKPEPTDLDVHAGA